MYYYFANTQEDDKNRAEVDNNKKRESSRIAKISEEGGEKKTRDTKRTSASISFEELTSQLGEENQSRKTALMQKYSVPI
jgi:hypothetical protein